MPITTAQIFAGLQYTDHERWPGSTVTFSIPSNNGMTFWSASSYPAGDEPSNAAYGVLSNVQAIAFVNAIGAWERLIDLDIVQVSDTQASQGDIRIAFTNTSDYSDGDPAAYAYRPPDAGGFRAAFHGDIWVDDDYKDDTADFGDFLYATFLHELGHALGLKHPFDGARLPAEFDTTRYTVMSYTDFADSSLRWFELDGGTLFASTFTLQPSTPMLLDVIAIQGIYGASTSEATGNDTYAIGQDDAFMATLVDNGGIDTFDLRSHTRASRIDLTPGTYSSIALNPIASQIAYWQAAFPNFSPSFIADYLNRPDTYTWTDNLATTPQTVIENVLAGSGSDTILGNAANNSIAGNAGSDSVAGGAGADTITGGGAGAGGNYLRGDDGDDSLVGGDDFDDINGNMGADTVMTGGGMDFCVGGKDNDLLFGGGGDDYTYGNLGDDTCSGEDGADTVRGGQGNDTLSGGAGNDFVSGDRGDDTMIGGAGADLFHSSADAGIDRVLDFNAGQGDRVLLDPGTTFQVMQIGGDTVIQMSGGQVILVGVQMSSLPPGSIFGA
ncbi:MAG: matrixin family metalloprotease [Phenylobacterium sp.]|uniref:matrixin family metalloprotease n=1 Tax=Phenylobacterium sp. TaxID=1871053 RepID=UPI001A3A74BE|nr:matrixin family metalloprotease [Phenylobacterium sp.]MBL8555073.1 matrixin family metalloprotease [Phenylobacterium sp.]